MKNLGSQNTPIIIRGRALALGGLFLCALLGLSGCATSGGGGGMSSFLQGFSQGMKQSPVPQQSLQTQPQAQTCHTSDLGGGYTRVVCQ